MDRPGKDDALDETAMPTARAEPAAPDLAATQVDPAGETRRPVTGELRKAANRATTGEPGPGAKLDHFTVLERLGSGGMGVVLAAYDPDLDRKVAIKLLRPDVFGAGSDAARARLQREAQAMAKLTHPNVITVHEVGVVDDRVFVAMEYVDGGTLRAVDDAAPRPWRAVLDVYLQAGRGLAAAHRAGLVHRDFKPDNVLVGKDGRVRVTDFGLVGMVGDAAGSDAGAGSTSQSDLTVPGSIMGTPAYMAPEQHAGKAVDARADQFAFCVSLHEALYGVRPFAGDSYEQLSASARAGRVVAPPAGIEVPGWLRAVILRGLSVDPAARYPDMDAVLAALAYDRRHARRRTAIVVAGFALVLTAAAVAVAVLPGDDTKRCQGARGQLAGVWDDAVRGRVAAAFAADPAIAVHGTPVTRAIDAYAEGWAAMWTDACEATHVRGDQTGATLDLRMRCLHRRRDELGELVGLWTGDRTTLARALEAASLLPAVATCADLDALATAVPLPADPAARQRIEVLQRELAAIVALRRSGAYAATVPRAQSLAEAAAATGYAPLRAEALMEVARLRDGAGDFDAGIQAFREAATEAGRAGNDALVAEAWIGLASLHLGRARNDLVEELLVLAEAAVARSGDPISLVRELAGVRGTLRMSQGRYPEARTALEESVALYTRSLGPDHPRTLMAIRRLAGLYLEMGELERGRTLLTEVLATEEKAYGPSHPELLGALNNLALAHDRSFQLAEARALFERALAIASTTLAPDHPDLCLYHGNLGATLWRLGELDLARTHLERAIAIGEAKLGPDHPDVTRAIQNMAGVERAAGNYPRARELLERALATNLRELGAEHPLVASGHGALGGILAKLGEPALARDHFQRALAIYERVLGEDHPDVAEMLNEFGVALEADGRLDEAAANYARALAIAEKLGADSPQLPYALTNLGGIANEQGRHRDAIAYCERVRALDVAALGADHQDVAYSLTCLGVALRGLGRATEAIELLEQGLALRAGRAAPDLEAESRFELARALWSVPRERGRARELGLAARDLFDQAGPGFVVDKREVDAWLRGHRAP